MKTTSNNGNSRQAEIGESTAVLAIKRELTADLRQAMKRQKISQSELARRMCTSRAVIHRLLKEDDPSVTLATISRVAGALGLRVRIRFSR